MMRQNENLDPRTLNSVLRQLGMLQEEKLDGIHVLQNEDDLLDIQAVFEGPTQTPYEGGVFRVRLVLGAEFPSQPPRAFFLTKIFHPNIAPSGDVCVNTLKRDWDPSSWSIRNILQVIRCLLIVPFPESALNEEAGRLIMESYEEYASHARMMTSVHAMPQAPLTQSVSGPTGTGGSGEDGAELAKKKALKQAQKAKKSLKRL
jgi:ubiquitin-conjugating enzyme E2 S